jgi:hypothetical protein
MAFLIAIPAKVLCLLDFGCPIVFVYFKELKKKRFIPSPFSIFGQQILALAVYPLSVLPRE